MSIQTIIAPSHIGDYKFRKTIGEGAFSVVKLALNEKTNEYFACKIVPRSSLNSKELEERFEVEIRINQQLHHPGIVQIIDLLKDEMNYYIFMEFCPNGELFKYIVERQKLTEDEAKLFIYQILKALTYVHSLGIAHRDLKPENLLFDPYGKLKISDFGLSRFVGYGGLVETPCGSPCYASPECLSGDPYDGRKSDMWSLGVILYAMVTGQLPWTKRNQTQLFIQIRNGEYRIPDYLSPECKEMITKMMMVDSSKRLSAADAIKMPWLESVPCLIDYESNDSHNKIVSLKKVDKFFDKETNDLNLDFIKDEDPGYPSQRPQDYKCIVNELKYGSVHSRLPALRKSEKRKSYTSAAGQFHTPLKRNNQHRQSGVLEKPILYPKFIKAKIPNFSTFT